MVTFDTVRWNNDTIHGWFETVHRNVAIIPFSNDTVHTHRYRNRSCEAPSEGSGMFWIVPFCIGDSESFDSCTFTRMPGGKGLGVGSDLFRRRPQVRPPS